MLKLKSLAFFLFATTALYSQSFIPIRTIGDFKAATSFYINSAGSIFVTDKITNELFKLDSLGNVEKDAGGYGWNEGNFDDPSDVFATTLNIYVCDKNNHRVERFDKFLNYISNLYTHDNDNRGERFGYPLCCATSQQGDLFILDSENKRIVKFDLFGNYLSNFGGYDAGNFKLNNPSKFAISSDNNIYVIDGENIVIFDQYGNGLSKIDTKISLEDINISAGEIIINSKDSVLISSLSKNDLSFNKIILNNWKNEEDIVSSFIFSNRLYILTKINITVFK